MPERLTKRRKGRRPPLDEDLILSWADEYFQKCGVWPNAKSGPIAGHDGENWHAIDMALRQGYRGLLSDSTLALLLHERRGAYSKSHQPKLRVEKILAWADQHLDAYGKYPESTDVAIEAAPTETWRAVHQALLSGLRGLPGGCTLAQLLQEHRGKRNRGGLPKLSLETILEWADEHYERTGRWPNLKSGSIPSAPGEQWLSVNYALRNGWRGLPSSSSLGRILIQYRGKRDIHNAPYSIDEIAQWMRSYAARHGKYPSVRTGTVDEAPSETWNKVNTALFRGFRGLPGGSSLAKLKESLIEQGKLHLL